MKTIITCVTAIFFAVSLHAQQQPKQENDTAQFLPKTFGTSANANTKLAYKIIDAPNNTYGYDVLADGRLLIHQKSIPAMPGNDGFKTKADASRVAQLVIGKIKKGEMPPTVTIEEMKKLKVIK